MQNQTAQTAPQQQVTHSQPWYTAPLLPPSAVQTTTAAYEVVFNNLLLTELPTQLDGAAASLSLLGYTPSRGFVELFCRRCRSSRSSAREECETPSFSLKVAVRASCTSSSASSLQRQQASTPLHIGCQWQGCQCLLESRDVACFYFVWTPIELLCVLTTVIARKARRWICRRGARTCESAALRSSWLQVLFSSPKLCFYIVYGRLQ